MAQKPASRRPIGRQTATPPSRSKAAPVPGGPPLPASTPSLAEQKSDFTAEGSPPPGKVATTAPVSSTEPDPPAR
jgi:hypothetical protein